jgi:hypothetical protein
VRLLAAAALIATVMAGCASSPDGPTEGQGLVPTTIAWSLDDCLHMVWTVPTRVDVLQRHLPAGFTPQAGDGGMGSLAFEAFECDAGAGLNGSVPGLAYGSIFVVVQAPAEYGCDQLPGGCYVKTDVLVPDAERRAWLQDAGVSAHGGSADVSVDAAGTWTASLVMEDVGGFGMQGVLAGSPAGGLSGGFAEFMQARDGITVWRGTVADAQTAPGAGAWSADPGTWVANEVGMAGPTTWSGGTWSFNDGSITNPA